MSLSGFKYLQTKGIGKVGHPEGKTSAEWSLSQKQVQAILDCAHDSKNEFNSNWGRDYALIFLAYSLGLRVGESILLERRHFSDLFDDDVVHIPTLKNVPRVKFECPNCNKPVRVRQNRIGEIFQCRCGAKSRVQIPNKPLKQEVPELDLPFIEEATQNFILEYIKAMRPDQGFFFESKPGKHISKIYASRIFWTFVSRAGLSNLFSFHSLRHGRGKRVYGQMKDLVSVMKSLRHHSIHMAQKYADLDEDMKKDAKSKLKSSNIIKTPDFGLKK